MTVRLSEDAERDTVSGKITSAVTMGNSMIIVGEFCGDALEDGIFNKLNGTCTASACTSSTTVSFPNINYSEGGTEGVAQCSQ